MSVVTRTNLCTNPSFEVSTTGVTAGGSIPPSLATSTAQHSDRAKSLLVTWGTGGFFPQISYTFTAVVGLTYTVSQYVRVPAGSPAVAVFVQGSAGAVTTLHDAWERLVKTVTATSTTITVQLLANSAPTSGQTFYLDAILCENAPIAASYFDGAASGCVWTGTTDLSTSQQLDGPLSITVTNDPANSPPRNILFVTGAPGATAQLTRTDPSGAQTPVRSGDPAPLVTGAWVGYDYEAPYNAGCTYTVIPSDATPNAFTAATPLESPQPWLIHPGVPSLSLPVTGILLTDDQSDSGTALHAPLGRPDPIPVSDGARKTPAFQVSFRTGGEIFSFPGGFTFPGVLTFPGAQDQNDALKAILQDSAPLMLQIVYPYTDIAMYRWISIDRVTTARVTMQFGDQQRVWTLDCTEITRPAGGIAAQRTWADLVAECATWQDVMNKFRTWTGVITGIEGT
jgi:hypothetical protein